MSDTARDQAQAQMESVRRFVAALNCDFYRLSELQGEWDDLMEEGDAAAMEAWKAENAEELEEFEVVREMLECGEISDCDQDSVIELIRNDALDVQTRSGWTTVGETMEAEEFRIILCTGGPHVEIVGELSQGEPSRAWLEYRGWGESGERVNEAGDQEALLTYSSQFCFGE